MAKTSCVKIRSPHTNTSPLPPKNKPNTGTPRFQRSEIPGMAGREGASPRYNEDNKRKRAAGGELGKRSLGWAGNGTTVGVGTGNKSPGAVAASSGGLEEGRVSYKGARRQPPPVHSSPALPGPWARGTGRSQRRWVPAGIGERERGSGRRLALFPRIGRSGSAGGRGPGRCPGPVKGQQIPAVPETELPLSPRRTTPRRAGSRTHLPGRAQYIEGSAAAAPPHTPVANAALGFV